MGGCDAKSATVLIAEDDADDALLLERAIRKNRIRCQVHRVVDGEELIAYLEGKGRYSDRAHFPMARLIILDLKMPRKNGFDVLAWLRKHPVFHVIPTLVFSSSAHKQDIARSYSLGANTYLVKPGTFSDLERLVRIIHDYWMAAQKSEPVELI